MELAASQPTNPEADELRASLYTPGTVRIDGLPHHPNPQAEENRIAATLDKINLLEQRHQQARKYMAWILPAWELLPEDDRYVLENFFLADGTQEDRGTMTGDHIYIERDSVYRKKNRALDRLANALYGKH